MAEQLRTLYNYNYNYSMGSETKNKQPNLRQYYQKQGNPFQKQVDNFYQREKIGQDRLRGLKQSRTSDGSLWLGHQNQPQLINFTKQYLNSTEKTSSNQFFSSVNNFQPQSLAQGHSINRNTSLMQRNSPLIQLNTTLNQNKCVQSFINNIYNQLLEFQRYGDGRILKELNTQNSLDMLQIIKSINSTKKVHDQKIKTKQTSNKGKIQQNNIQDLNGQKARKDKQKQNMLKQNIKQSLNQLSVQSKQINEQALLEQQIYMQLKNQLSQQIQQMNSPNLNASRIRQQNHLHQMQQSITQLSDQIKFLERKNIQIAKSLHRRPFFKEWSLMFDEAKGATKLTIKLQRQLNRRQQLLRNLGNKISGDHNAKNLVNKIPNFKKQPTTQNQQVPTQVASPIEKSRTINEQFFRPNPIVRHLSHSIKQKKSSVSNSIQKFVCRQQSVDKKHSYTGSNWKNIPVLQQFSNNNHL